MEHKKVLEAALFLSDRPLMLDELAKITSMNSLGAVKQMLEELQKEYEVRGMEITGNDKGWTMQVRQSVLAPVAHLTPYSDLSEGSKRTLALIVYKEPARQADVISVQGNKAYTYIRELERKGLIKSEKRGNTRVLVLTMEFERYFGEEKEKIKEKLKRIGGSMEKRMESGEYKEPGSRQKTLIDVDGVPLAKQPELHFEKAHTEIHGLKEQDESVPEQLGTEESDDIPAKPESRTKKKEEKKYAPAGTDKISIDQEINF